MHKKLNMKDMTMNYYSSLTEGKHHACVSKNTKVMTKNTTLHTVSPTEYNKRVCVYKGIYVFEWAASNL